MKNLAVIVSVAFSTVLGWTAFAALPFKVSCETIDFGEVPVRGSVTRQFKVCNLSDEYLPVRRIAADDGLDVFLFEDVMDPKRTISVEVSLRGGDRPGPVSGVVRLTVGGIEDMSADIRFKGMVVDGDSGVSYPMPRFNVPGVHPTVKNGERVAWTCPERTELYLNALHGTNRLQIARGMIDAAGSELNPEARNRVTLMCCKVYYRVMRELFVQRLGSDDERRAALAMPNLSRDGELSVAKRDFAEEPERRRREELMKKQAAEAARLRSEAIENAHKEAKKRKEEQARRWAELQAEQAARESEYKEEIFWRRVGLPGVKLAPVWKEYIEGEGRAYADNEHFKTNVFMPFFIKEFGVDRETKFRDELVNLLETEFADLLCHTGDSTNRVRNLERGEFCLDHSNEKAQDMCVQLWKKGCKSPLVNAICVYAHKGLPARSITGSDGKRQWLLFYDYTADDLPKGRDGLALRFFREATGSGQRIKVNVNFAEDRGKALCEWCRALEKEGARPEQWRCVMLMTLRFLGRGAVSVKGSAPVRPDVQLADALEKANCAPVLVRMFREEPIYTGKY